MRFGPLCCHAKAGVMLIDVLEVREGCSMRCPTRLVFLFCSWQVMEHAVAERIDEFIGKLKDLKRMASPFTLVSNK